MGTGIDMTFKFKVTSFWWKKYRVDYDVMAKPLMLEFLTIFSVYFD